MPNWPFDYVHAQSSIENYSFYRSHDAVLLLIYFQSLVVIYKDFYIWFCFFAFHVASLAVPNGKYMGETRRTIQWCNRSFRCDPYRFHDNKSHRLSEFARIITLRSDLSGAATPESSYPEPGFFFG